MTSLLKTLARPVRAVSQALIAVALLAGCGSVAWAQLTVVPELVITVGDHGLVPNTAGQVVQIQVQNTSNDTDFEMAGLLLNVQVADGQASTPAPNITGVNILTDTAFASNNTGQQNASQAHIWVAQTTTASDTVLLAKGTSTILATITLDTTGLSGTGPWSFNLDATLNGPTIYYDLLGNELGPVITDGHLTVVPEPMTSLAVGALLTAFAAAWRWKRVKP